MIKLHRLNDTAFVLNANLIQYVEETPDTVITLTSQRKLMIKESMDEVITKVIDFSRQSNLAPLLS